MPSRDRLGDSDEPQSYTGARSRISAGPSVRYEPPVVRVAVEVPYQRIDACHLKEAVPRPRADAFERVMFVKDLADELPIGLAFDRLLPPGMLISSCLK